MCHTGILIGFRFFQFARNQGFSFEHGCMWLPVPDRCFGMCG
uniref:Uncharacterized protein n=1 Tax=Faecalibaculum rodentium TaxID=1702221 RepID=A0A140DUR2_9FIRM|nr:hypothetical protein AALO17_12550 [Faecalibaculum rodentium]